jgi:hypothetical protein
MIVHLLYAAGGFILGALVYRNNPQLNKTVLDLKEQIEILKNKIK